MINTHLAVVPIPDHNIIGGECRFLSLSNTKTKTFLPLSVF